jgi:uncharacterized membrane protein
VGEVTYASAWAGERRSSRRRFDVETLVASVLIAGLLASVALIASGVLWLYARTSTFRIEDVLPPTDVGAFVLGSIQHAASPDVGPRRLINVGIGVLMLTPYLRVLSSLLYFLAVRDWKYSLFTSVVLLALTYSMI